MLITDNGTIDGRPQTSMVKRDGVWLRLLVCRVDGTNTDEALTALFQTETVEDDAISVRWCYTIFDSIRRDDAYAYVWLTYTTEQSTVPPSEELEEALNILGVETQEEGEPIEG